jgi:hypothetical protein
VSCFHFYLTARETGLESYRFGTPFGHILLSVESVSKGLQVPC